MIMTFRLCGLEVTCGRLNRLGMIKWKFILRKNLRTLQRNLTPVLPKVSHRKSKPCILSWPLDTAFKMSTLIARCEDVNLIAVNRCQDVKMST